MPREMDVSDGERVGHEQQQRAPGQIPVGELGGDTDDGQGRNERNGHRHAGQGVGHVTSGVGVSPGCSGGQGDGQVEKIGAARDTIWVLTAGSTP